MMADGLTYKTIDEYISVVEATPEVRQRLRELHEFIHCLMPEDATERISWQMPTFYWHGNLVHFAAFKHHIGLYPGASGVENIAPKLDGYKYSKGAIQFPHARPLPYALIEEIVRFRIEENRPSGKA